MTTRAEVIERFGPDWRKWPYRHIETYARLSDGREIITHYSFPETTTYEKLMEIDDKLCDAFGSQNCRTFGTPGEPVRIKT